MTDTMPPEKTERLAALLGLAASKRQKAGFCPPDEELTAFVNGKLKGNERQRMLAHMNDCPECYYHWLEVSVALNGTKSWSEARSRVWRLSGVWQRFTARFFSWQVAVPAVTAACALCLIVLWSAFPPSTRKLDPGFENESYATPTATDASRPTYAAPVIRYTAKVAQTLNDLVLPWEQPALGFSETQLTRPKQAFGAGLWTGKNTPFGEEAIPLPEALSPPPGSDWEDTQWAVYHQFGRWTVILWALAKTEHKGDYWHDHSHVLNSLVAHFTKRAPIEHEATHAVAALRRIQTLLAAVANQADHQTCSKLARELMITMQRLGPTNV